MSRRRHAGRIGHVHLKDVDAAGRAPAPGRARSERRPAVVPPLGRRPTSPRSGQRFHRGKKRWLVLEQDLGHHQGEHRQSDGEGPVLGVRNQPALRSLSILDLTGLTRATRFTPEALRQHGPWSLAAAASVLARATSDHCGDDDATTAARARESGPVADPGRGPHVRGHHPRGRRDRSGRWPRRAPSRPARTWASRSSTRSANNDPQKQAQLIDAAVTQRVDGLVVSVSPGRDPRSGLAKAKAPASRSTRSTPARTSWTFGAITHVGQDETIAGEAAGSRLSGGRQEGALRHPRAGNTAGSSSAARAPRRASAERENLQVGHDDIATSRPRSRSKLQADNSIDAS